MPPSDYVPVVLRLFKKVTKRYLSIVTRLLLLRDWTSLEPLLPTKQIDTSSDLKSRL